jgi:hypothetical protein
MAVLPQGTITFLFTDVEGSTRLLRELGDAFPDVELADEALALTRASLPAETFVDEWSRGEQMVLDAAVAAAVQSLD